MDTYGSLHTLRHGFKCYGRTLVHFALDTEEVWMTIRLAGEATHFLPFKTGYDGVRSTLERFVCGEAPTYTDDKSEVYVKFFGSNMSYTIFSQANNRNSAVIIWRKGSYEG